MGFVRPTFKSVMRWDSGCKILRLFRVCRNFDGPFDGRNYAWAFSLALSPRLFRWRREYRSWFLTAFGLRFHYQQSFGGNFG